MPNLHVHSPFSIFHSQLLHPCVNPAIPGKINAVMKMKLQTPAVFALGAAGYAALELLWRGRTHWTMALTGGAVLVGLRRLRRRVHEESPLSRCLCGMHHGGGICGRLHGQPAFPAARVGLLARIRQCSRADLPEIRRAVDAARRADYAAEIRRKCMPLPLQYGFQWLIIVVNYAEKETHHADRSQCRKQPRFARRL